MVLTSWEKVSPQKLEPLMVQFAASLKKLKDSIKKWLPIWKERRFRTLLDTEEKLKDLYQILDEGPLSEGQLEELKSLENLHYKWLKLEEQEWRQKSRVVWIKEGDNNTQHFH
jgi:hypothetical protein